MGAVCLLSTLFSGCQMTRTLVEDIGTDACAALPLTMRLARQFAFTRSDESSYDAVSQLTESGTHMAASRCDRSSSTREGLMDFKSDSDRKDDD